MEHGFNCTCLICTSLFGLDLVPSATVERKPPPVSQDDRISSYPAMIQSPMWKALEKADTAVFEAQQVFERNGFAGDFLYQARLKLGQADNQLRRHFKRGS